MKSPPTSGSLDVVPMFRGAGGSWTRDFLQAANEVTGPLDLDVVAVASMLSFQYVIDGRSLVSQVARRPWLATVAPGDESAAALALHGRRLMTQRAAARELLTRLRAELSAAFADAARITLLLSGGLDSRLASAVLVEQARRGEVTDRIRALTWGIAASRDRHYGRRVAQHLGVEWVPVELGPADLAGNIGIAARELGALVSPVHLHAMDAVRRLDWGAGDRILASTLGNGVGRGQYMLRHVSHAKPVRPQDWLSLMRPEFYARLQPQLAAELDGFRHRLGPRGPVAVHECEMLAHYVSGMLLPALDCLRRTAAPVHQAFADPGTYGFVWSLSPLIRTEAMFRTALRLCDPMLVEIPYARNDRPPRRFGRPAHSGLSPHFHRYPVWIAHDLAEPIDGMLSRAWFDDTGVFDGAAIRRAWEGVRLAAAPHPQTAYVLIWLCTLRCLVEELALGKARAAARLPPPVASQARQRPPWGFAGRDPDPVWHRLAALPRQLSNLVR